jgi:[ribosomal protein S18]-alanine N-acetyltransferase
VKIRTATVADIPSLMSLERQCATAGHWTEDQYRQVFQPDSPARLLLLAEASPSSASNLKFRGTGVLGFLVAHHLAPEWELENVVVAPAVRRHGLGKLLLEALLAAALENNSIAIFLEVRESNIAARTLYEISGFERTGRRKAYYTDPPEDAILYRRTLR